MMSGTGMNTPNKRIKINKAKCPVCLQVIVSKYRHDYVSCRCGHLSVDGGQDYLKRGTGTSVEPPYIELSEYEDA